MLFFVQAKENKVSVKENIPFLPWGDNETNEKFINLVSEEQMNMSEEEREDEQMAKILFNNMLKDSPEIFEEIFNTQPEMKKDKYVNLENKEKERGDK